MNNKVVNDRDRFAVPDFERFQRKGVPEIILSDRKTVEQSLAIARDFLARTGRAILSRVDSELSARVKSEFGSEFKIEWVAPARSLVLRLPDMVRPSTDGRVGVITAGTSDIPVAEEAGLMCCEMGCKVFNAYDVGVAGLHRLFDPLSTMLNDAKVDVLIVAAGMDGALPSVVAGLVDVPVIGVPVSIGYGLGGEGVAALYSMLQTCAPGLSVVNIDNGIGAGAVAGLIANRMAAARQSVQRRGEY